MTHPLWPPTPLRDISWFLPSAIWEEFTMQVSREVSDHPMMMEWARIGERTKYRSNSAIWALLVVEFWIGESKDGNG